MNGRGKLKEWEVTERPDIEKKTCPNCGKQLAIYAYKCKYCDTRMNGTTANIQPNGTTANIQPNVTTANIQPNVTTANIQPVLPVLEPFMLSGVHAGLVMLTPLQVKYTHPPGLLKERAVLEIDLSICARQLHSAQWKDNNSGKITYLGVYETGLLFPPVCPASMTTATHCEWAEVPISRRNLAKVEFNVSQEKADRIMAATTCDRYWVAIPFSDGRSLDDRAVYFTTPSTPEGVNYHKTTVIFTNREFARQFYELNNLKKGKWFNIKCRYMHLAGLLGLLTGGFLIIAGVIYIWRR